MPFTLAFQDSPGLAIPAPDGIAARPTDRHEHFGTELLALRRAADLLPGPDWLDLRLYGPDGCLIAAQPDLLARLDALSGAGDPIRDKETRS